MAQTQGQTSQYQMMTTRTSLPSPANGLHSCSSQTPLGAACPLTFQHVLELEVLFEDHGVRSCTITPLPRSRACGSRATRAGSTTTYRPTVCYQAKVSSVSTRSHSHRHIPSSHQWICTPNLRLDACLVPQRFRYIRF